jgi:lipoprotein-anchoring transpeptidase ErfK/SrfK
VAVTAGLVAVVGAAGLTALAGHLVRVAPAVLVAAAPAAPVPVAVSPPAPAAVHVPASTVLAAPIGTVPTYLSPGAPSDGTVGTWYTYPLVLPVVAEQPGWFEVRLPQRPNGLTAWVRSNTVTVSSTPYWIVVNLGTEHLTVYQGGHPIMAFPVGIGVAATPTVTGHYFVAVHEPHSDPVYGPVILDLSAHSDAIRSWEGAGDAIIAIHGPIDSAADALIGTTGARVSNGCIRLHDADLEKLSVIPTGTPVDIDA